MTFASVYPLYLKKIENKGRTKEELLQQICPINFMKPTSYEARKIFSIFLLFANSSTNLSKYLTCCVRGSLMSSRRTPQITPVMRCAFGFSDACWKNSSKVAFSFISS